MKTRLVGGLLAILGAAPLGAQQSPVAARVAGSLDTKFVEPDCDLPGGGDFRIRSGRTYLNTGITGSGDPANRARALKDGVRVISDAIANAGQAKNPAAWYYLGRLYLHQGDLAGADSAFTRAAALAPQCGVDIERYRYRTWVALVSEGLKFRQAGQDDSAMVMFRAANQIHRSLPLSFLSMADVFNGQKQNDSALVYFGLAAATEPSDTNQVKYRNQAAYNYGALLLNAQRAEEAVKAFRRYVQLEPGDPDGKKALARALRAAGNDTEAQEIEKELLAASGGPAGGPGGASLSEAELYDLAAKQYHDKNYAAAAATAGRILEANPHHRDALNIRANSFLALQQWDSLAATADRLVTIEPLSYFFHSMRIQAYRSVNDRAKMTDAVLAREALPADLEISESSLGSDGAVVSGVAKGREAVDANSKPIPPRDLTLVFEFLDQHGGVVATREVPLPKLAKDSTRPVAVEVKGSGIKGWRYRVP